ncbi:MAG: sensor histidine kinase [Sarcina sp.]
MSLQKHLYKFLKYKKREIIALVANTFLVILFYNLFYKNAEIIYPMTLSLFVISIYMIIEFIRFEVFLRKIDEATKTEMYDSRDMDFLQKIVLTSMSEIHKNYSGELTLEKLKSKNRDTLFSNWIHNIKTSLSVIDLACETSQEECITEKTKDCINDIIAENNCVKKNLEEALNVIRLDDFSNDYITDSINLKELIREAINNKKRDFIYSKIFPKVKFSEDIDIYTDKKWCSYLIGQVIDNAIKYSKENGRVEFDVTINDDKTILYIKDYGIGIKENQIQSVFNEFFTGDVGRENRNSTGIGLYMVKIISEKLGHKIEINSEYAEWTEFKIEFMKPKNIF